MAFEGESVGVFAGNAVMLCDALGGEAHREVGAGMILNQPGIDGDLVASHGDHGHGLCATGNDDIGSSAADALSGEGDGLQAGGAEAVDGHSCALVGQTSAQSDDAGEVHALFGFGHGTADDDVVDFVGIELRHAVERTTDGDGSKIVGTGGAQGSAGSPADGGTDTADDDGISHD